MFSLGKAHLHNNILLGGADEIGELRRRENEMQVEPDWEIDAFMKASVRHGKRHNIRTDYTLRLLGLEVVTCRWSLTSRVSLACSYSTRLTKPLPALPVGTCARRST